MDGRGDGVNKKKNINQMMIKKRTRKRKSKQEFIIMIWMDAIVDRDGHIDSRVRYLVLLHTKYYLWYLSMYLSGT